MLEIREDKVVQRWSSLNSNFYRRYEMLVQKVKSLLSSRRFWVSAVGLAGICSSELLGVELDVEQIVGVVTIVVAWVIGDSVRPTE